MSDPPPEPLVAPPPRPVDNRNIRFSLERGDLDLDQLLLLLNRNAFWAQNRRREEMERALAHSYPVVSAWDRERLIGFGRATSDGVYRAVLWDIVVDSDYQRQGIGRKLVETLISHPHLRAVERIYLFTTHQRGFYERIGFVENPSTTLVLYGRSLELLLPTAEQAQA
ncbi:GNAT family N-acetyltransferase [Synechococcus sp. H65.1]|uniref:GNAT family N-acetyltransferase n=1 Tax=unclassified Synechococcus TaxID=2626047 RepID=UPI0039C0BE37